MTTRRIKIYSCTPCTWCDRVKTLLTQHGFSYESEDITDDEAKWERLSRENNGWRTVPMVFIDGTFVGGFPETQAWIKQHTSQH
jgi:glutaredoxin 3